ncbi:hypothetical protein [Claveliimonas bilis]|uniref:DegT/DnrJ/EryC1/StrS aminotransferase family protein n=1 Tax=Claveliimonas bilis TaxID=3028070 RepID=A0ABM8ICW2_9FIRM|nr:hypothetical protein [Claveliimonas bilis]BDZ78155.1 hypothetical protein Lac1_23380 [Claveliimonas bilis]
MAWEIGSEFHRVLPDRGHGLRYPILGSLVFSGRTAIETVLKEIIGARKAALPSYCCYSMIQPFKDAGIEVEFYPVYFENGLKIEVDIPENTDIILWCNYFGFMMSMPDLSKFQGVIIEDVTHSLFSENPCHPQSHYLVASLRKWEPINCGGYCSSVNGKIHYEPTISPPVEYMRLKKEAMELKREYLLDFDKEKKPRFLSMFEESNHWLAENYSGLSIDLCSKDYLSTVDVGEQRRIRRRNAKVLYEGLEEKVQFLFSIEDMDCPLFVPILLHNQKEIKRELSLKQIYCPIHWPRPDGCDSNLYDQELSLICDQRYNEEDMERLVSVLKTLL